MKGVFSTPGFSRIWPYIFLLIVIGMFAPECGAQYSWQSAFPNLPTFANPIELVQALDGSNRFFVVEQRGVIYVFDDMPNVSTRKTFLNIADRVSQSGGETGLLGLAFHPNYSSNGYFYVNYTNTVGNLKSFIARYKVSAANPDSADKSSELILMTVDQPYSNHNGGKVDFGSDGYLYISLGDGGSGNDPGNRAQNRSTLLGKLLRINVDSAAGGNNYAIPPSNPYVGNVQGFREEIYAYGLRNGWKFSFDPVAGRLWLGDVGQDAREEVDIIVSGGNYGWRLMEGNICNPTVNPTCQDTAGLIRPVWDYVNGSGSNADGSITGGVVYNGSAIPSLAGKYIYGDFVSGRTWALTFVGISPATNFQLSDESYLISTFGVDASGEVYLCSYSSSGRIYKLVGPPASSPGGGEPESFQLRQNFPNPFNPNTVIQFEVSSSQEVSLTVYDLLGTHVRTLINGIALKGVHTSEWDGTDFRGNPVATGIYLYRLQTEDRTESKKMVLLR